ncbi:lysylphosphatidylglycerol synthase transmembrane domain-containing protein [Halarchaeum nitratireducens]|uniref:TIGR00374 family protein n=1 Tax=Halarchaeum nitratireducens TaxID=489913 RepID=A0A830G7W5_9EURY|nr:MULTISPECIES: lysylphosphatidylglycerol synthase transmembrane domain-containing protein [Halarchaeum]MBP2251211.1 uncharacterized protein (TIRG00374 family) [Halarchaeum solikamskense]GGN06734.1 TIGR00374 family protein [Halarchaeum nitratireducens]
MEFDSRAIGVGFAAVVAVLALLVWVVGVDDIARTLSLLEPRTFAVILAVGLAWLVAWALALRRVLDALGVAASAWDAVLLYAAAAFANNITPFGQAGGEPFSALLISRATDSEYETGLAAIASVDTLNFVPSIVLALVGLTYYVARYAAGDSVRFVFGVVVALAITVPAVAALAWRYRAATKRRLVGVVHPVWARLGRHLPRVSAPGRDAIRARVDGFVRSIERVATSRRDLAIAVTWSALGWCCLCLALYLSLWTLTPATDINAAIVFIAVPVATIASVTPLPGGAGGVEAALVLLLVPTTGVTAATATSAAIVFRAAVYWAPTVAGGGAAAWLELRARR